MRIILPNMGHLGRISPKRRHPSQGDYVAPPVSLDLGRIGIVINVKLNYLYKQEYNTV